MQDAREQTHQRQEAGNLNAAPDRPVAATNQTMAMGWHAQYVCSHGARAFLVCVLPWGRSVRMLGWVGFQVG